MTELQQAEQIARIIYDTEHGRNICRATDCKECVYYPIDGDICPLCHAAKEILNAGYKQEDRSELAALRAFKQYFDSLYGTGVEVANWHYNGTLEAFDNFYDAAMEEYEKEKGEAQMKIRINTHGNPLPEKEPGGDWYDLRASEDVEMKEGELKIIPLGISIEIPAGYTAYILPRSSTPKKFGIQMANSMGVIDQTYCGDNDVLGFVAKAIRDTKIEKGTRIAQLAIYKAPEALDFQIVERLGNEDRGGFGSTGTK